MPHIYITDETKEMLDKLAQREHRTISKEVEFLISSREKELSVSMETPVPSTGKLHITTDKSR